MLRHCQWPRLCQGAPRRRPLSRSLAVSVSASSKRLILYSKPGCSLCEGLQVGVTLPCWGRQGGWATRAARRHQFPLSLCAQEKVQGLLDRAQFMPSLLSEYELEVRGPADCVLRAEGIWCGSYYALAVSSALTHHLTNPHVRIALLVPHASL